ncbi:MAG: cytochrome c biogenesis protein CcsA [Bacteroidales bacterium]|nr:cytochrome c biogenesis protein CcsA [Bacteroidales bacterium]
MAMKCKMWKQLAVGALHLSILFILLGALLTMLTGQHGRMKLEPNRPNSHFFIQEKGGEITKHALPFSLTLDRFEIETYPDSKKPKDYISHLKVTDGNNITETVISMNNILKHKHYRFYQSDFDEQGNSILDVARDPWGIGVTYTGYALLFIALAAILIEKRKMFRAITWSWISMLVILAIILHVRMLTRQLMPVLRSPFFSIHISTIVTAYALLIGIAVVGIIALVKPKDQSRLERLKSLSTAMLYPAVALLAAGIFIGAIWANVSWGNYWSWDPKEVWALITLLVYAAPLHEKLWKMFQKPLFFHIYCILAILSVVITYFGVNLILGGVHAYN